MQQRLKEKRQELLQGCQKELMGDDSQKQAILEELEQETARKKEAALLVYGKKYKEAMLSANRKALGDAIKKMEQFLLEQVLV
ncbi:hypothetical protein Y1Q_0000826 [Alligator mississippiensis]|uniref:Uncharacterized protein n=1 Tax=Alligator mississippiensis TaxID=8496 RepID=A0A151MVS7_ALLMI|nr:hypothetical protein Y1Q_0000826 [Alligator mississippiensis]